MPCSYVDLTCLPHLVFFRMTLLITVFLVLVNIFNTITTNIPKAEGLTAIESWVIVCVLFVFGALIGETNSGFIVMHWDANEARPCIRTKDIISTRTDQYSLI